MVTLATRSDSLPVHPPSSARAAIEGFLAEPRIALVGASQDPKDLSRVILRELVHRGYEVVPVNRRAAGQRFDDLPVVADLAAATTEPLGAALFMVPPAETLGLLRAAHAAGISKVWLHRGVGPGATTRGAAELAGDLGLSLVDGECPMMFFADATLVHRLHRSSRGLSGRFPVRVAPRRRPALTVVRVCIAVLTALVGLSAMVNGIQLVLDPTGAAVGLRPELLARSPFPSYTLPGLVLAGVVGLSQVATALTAIRRPARAPLLALAAGAILMGWIGGQWLFLTETHWLQPACFGLGLLEAALAFGALHLADRGLRAGLPTGPSCLERKEAVSRPTQGNP